MNNKKAFTFIEIMIVVALVGFLAAISMVNILQSRRTAEYGVCLENRRIIENAEVFFFANARRHSASIQELLDLGYLNKIPNCPSGGIFAWVPYEQNSPYYQTALGCSFHAAETVEEESSEKGTSKSKKPKKKK